MDPLTSFVEFFQKLHEGSTLTPSQLIVAKAIFETKAGVRMFHGANDIENEGIGKTTLLEALELHAHWRSAGAPEGDDFEKWLSGRVVFLKEVPKEEVKSPVPTGIDDELNRLMAVSAENEKPSS